MRIGDFFREHFTPRSRLSVRKRWLIRCLLPAAGIVTIAVVMASVYAFLKLDRSDAATTVVFAISVGLAVLLAQWLVCSNFIRGITDSLWLLKKQTGRIADGSYGIRTEKLMDDELGDLTESINEMSVEIARSKTMQSEFISSVSHELRTPLTAIMGWAEALGYDEAIQDDSRRGIEIISKEAGRLTKMVAELLEFTRIQDGRFNLEIETVDMAAEVEDAVYTYRNLMEQEGIVLRLDCEEETIPPVEADPERVKQVLLNILDNATKYGKSGKKVEVALTSDGEKVTITVRDHGPGIPEEILPRVKERFFKGASKERGNGIGLAVCEEIVTRHGGELLIENAEGGGVLVTIELPVRQSVEKEATNDSKQRK
ncbi:MAG: HAMP domain-containing histidine kinase [Oscillospiraceae bacterium]|nr:HAMP domain-containing histidine kinase [Oscillospiraceae bacterium]